VHLIAENERAFYAGHDAARRAACVMFVGLAFCFPFAWESLQLNSWVCYKASVALRNAGKVVLCAVSRNGSCAWGEVRAG